MLSSRLTKKRQATIPKEICTFLDLDSGDSVSFSIEKDRVVLKKTGPIDIAYLQATQGNLSTEWLSEEDSKAYNDL